jgi:hypothetical protein
MPTKWRVEVKGDLGVLEDAALVFCEPSFAVARDGDIFFLTSDQFESLDDDRQVEEVARRLLQRANGILALAARDHRPIEITFVVEIDANGHQTTYAHAECKIVFSGHAEVSPRLPRKPSRDPDNAQALLAIAQRDNNVADALRLWTTRPHVPAELYKILEVIERDADGQIANSGWATKAELDRFRATANRPELSGDDARHVRQSGRPPKYTKMSDAEAEQLMTRIINCWLESKV